MLQQVGVPVALLLMSATANEGYITGVKAYKINARVDQQTVQEMGGWPNADVSIVLALCCAFLGLFLFLFLFPALLVCPCLSNRGPIEAAGGWVGGEGSDE
eukprot:6477312-Amphidinium_carterae.2